MSDITQVVPAAEETEVSEDLAKKQKKVVKDNIQFVKPNGVWNKESIMSYYDAKNHLMVLCAKSGRQLYFLDRENHQFVLESFGVCVANGKPYHEEFLAIPKDTEKSGYPVEYEGCYSQEEMAKPLSEKEEAEIRKDYGV